MDLGIAGKHAIVCGASAGLGFAIAETLAREGVKLFIAARNRERLEQAAAKIAADTGGEVHPVVADVGSEEGRDALLAACRDPDILVNNAGGPPTGDFRDWPREEWIKALDMNMLAPILLMRAAIDGMIARRYGRIINVTSIMVKQPAAYLGLSNGARAGLTGFVGGLARDVAQHNVTINNLLPGRFDTDRLKMTQQHLAATGGNTLDAVRSEAIGRIPAGRFGDPREFGAMCAYLCSVQASFITGQNILLDGGEYPGLL